MQVNDSPSQTTLFIRPRSVSREMVVRVQMKPNQTKETKQTIVRQSKVNQNKAKPNQQEEHSKLTFR